MSATSMRVTATRSFSNVRQRQRGFTLIELILVMGILAVLYGISSISLSRLIPRATVVTSVETLRSELRLLQARAMQGDIGLEGGPSAFGVYFEDNQYTFFEGTSYVASSASNVVTTLEETVSLTTTLPNNLLVFERGSGEVMGYSAGQDRITVTNTEANDSRSFVINSYGVALDE